LCHGDFSAPFTAYYALKIGILHELKNCFHAFLRIIQDDWIQYVMDHPTKEVIQKDGRIRRWASIDKMNGRYLRVILLADGETVHNAFFDRSFKP